MTVFKDIWLSLQFSPAVLFYCSNFFPSYIYLSIYLSIFSMKLLIQIKSDTILQTTVE